MIDGMPVIDAVLHGVHFSPRNFCAERVVDVEQAARDVYEGLHRGLSPRDAPEYLLDPQTYLGGELTVDTHAWANFAECQTDIGIYHVVNFWALQDGGSNYAMGRALQERLPGRIWMYGGVKNPFGDLSATIEEIDQQIEEAGIIGLKLYPGYWDRGELRPYYIDDPEHALPLIEHCRSRGLMHMAVHKAIPIGPVVPQAVHNVADVEQPAQLFPDMTFEIVHGGFAFLDETLLVAADFPNVWMNLEGVPAWLNYAPRRFGEILGRMLESGLGDRTVWSTGSAQAHARPQIEKFAAFEMPEDLQAQYGYPEVTREIKAKIFAGNFARLHGWDLDQMVKDIPNDELRQAQENGPASPWSQAAVMAESV
jgi:uncharacterized protein